MKTQRLLCLDGFNVAEAGFDFFDSCVVSGGENNRNTLGSRVRSVVFPLGYRIPVQGHSRVMRAGKRMRANAVQVRRGCMVADKDGGIETRIQTAHHSAVSRPGAHDANVLRKLLDQEVLAVSV